MQVADFDRMALQLIPREGLVVLQKERLAHLKEKETGNANGRFWPKCVRDVAQACPRDVPGSPLGKLLEGSVKLKNAYLNAIRSSKLAADEPELVTAARLFEKLLRSEPAVPPVPPFQFAADDLQHVASWRSLYPAGSQLTALLLIGLLAFLTKRHQGSLPGKPPTLQLLRERYRSIPQSVPPSKVDAALLPIYTQQMQEQSRVYRVAHLGSTRAWRYNSGRSASRNNRTPSADRCREGEAYTVRDARGLRTNPGTLDARGRRPPTDQYWHSGMRALSLVAIRH